MYSQFSSHEGQAEKKNLFEQKQVNFILQRDVVTLKIKKITNAHQLCLYLFIPDKDFTSAIQEEIMGKGLLVLKSQLFGFIEQSHRSDLTLMTN